MEKNIFRSMKDESGGIGRRENGDKEPQNEDHDATLKKLTVKITDQKQTQASRRKLRSSGLTQKSGSETERDMTPAD